MTGLLLLWLVSDTTLAERGRKQLTRNLSTEKSLQQTVRPQILPNPCTKPFPETA